MRRVRTVSLIRVCTRRRVRRLGARFMRYIRPHIYGRTTWSFTALARAA
jgi:hypothetical protein